MLLKLLILALLLCAAPVFATAIVVSNTGLTPATIPVAGGSLVASATITGQGADAVGIEFYEDGVAFGSAVMSGPSSSFGYSGTLTVPANVSLKTHAWTAKISVTPPMGSATPYAVPGSAFQQFADHGPSVSNIAILPASVPAALAGGAGIPVTVTATVTDPMLTVNQVQATLNGFQNVSAGNCTTTLSNSGQGSVYIGSYLVPANATASAIPYTVSVVASDAAGNTTAAAGPAFTQPAAGITISAPVLSVVSAAPGIVKHVADFHSSQSSITSIPASGATVQVAANVYSVLGVSAVSAAFNNSSPTPVSAGTINLDSTVGTGYAGSIAIPANPTLQSLSWTVVLTAIAADNTASQTLSFTQPAGGPPVITAGKMSPASFPDGGGTATISATVRDTVPLSSVSAAFYDLTDGVTQLSSAQLQNQSGSMWSSSCYFGEADAHVVQNCIAAISAAGGQGSASYVVPFTFAPDSGLSITTPTLSAHTLPAAGGNLTVSGTVKQGSVMVPSVRIFLLNAAGPSLTLAYAGLSSNGSYSATIPVPANSLNAQTEYVIVTCNDSALDEVTANVPFTQQGGAVSAPTVSSVSAGPSVLNPLGDNINYTAQISAFNGGYYQGVRFWLIDEDYDVVLAQPLVGTGGIYSGTFPVAANVSGRPHVYTVYVTAENMGEGNTTVKIGTLTQAYIAPTLTAASVTPNGPLPAAGISVSLQASATATGGPIGVNCIVFANGVLVTKFPLEAAGNGVYNGSYSVLGNTTGLPVSYNFVYCTADKGGNGASATVGPFMQPYVPPTATSASVTPSPFADAASQAVYGVDAWAANGAQDVVVNAFLNGIYQPLASGALTTNGETTGNGNYTGSGSIPANINGANDTWNFVFNVEDAGGNYAQTSAGLISEPYVAPIISSASVLPAALPASSGTVKVTAVAAAPAGIYFVYGQLLKNGIYSSQFPVNEIIGGTKTSGTFTASLTLPPATGATVSYSIELVAFDTLFDTSTPQYFTVTVGPAITSISPTTTPALTPFTLTVNGSSFDSKSKVLWNETALTTTYVSTTQLTAAVSTAVNGNLSSYPGSADIEVLSGSGAPAIPSTMTITTPTPIITTGSPNIVQGVTAFTLTVNGNGFASGATVYWNRVALTTQFVSPAQLTAAVTTAANALLPSYPATAVINVDNPGNLSSTAVNINLTAPTPTMVSLTPPAALCGSPNPVNLTVTGVNFISGSEVLFNGTPLSVLQVSGTSVTATIPVSLLAQAGTANIQVVNPGAPGSAFLPFSILQAFYVIVGTATRNASTGVISIPVQVVNGSYATVSGVTLSGAMLGFSATSTALPIAIGTLGGGASSAQTILTFPGAAGTPGSIAVLFTAISYNAGSTAVLNPVVLP